MEPEKINVDSEKPVNILNKVTPFSKYLALSLFIAVPFIGGWIGYNYAPDKVVEIYLPQQCQTNETISVKESTVPLFDLEPIFDTQGAPTGFAKDGSNIYYSTSVIRDLSSYINYSKIDGVPIDYSTFEVLDGGAYIKDKNSVFVGLHEDYYHIPNANPATFKPLKLTGDVFSEDVFYGVAADDKRVYYYTKEFPEADVASFEALYPRLYRDAEHIYETELTFNYVIEGIDAKTFSYDAEKDVWTDINSTWKYDPVWGLRQVDN